MYTFIVQHTRALPHAEIMSFVSAYNLPRGGWNADKECSVWITRLHTHYLLEIESALSKHADVVCFEREK